jgi:hypothetical protein
MSDRDPPVRLRVPHRQLVGDLARRRRTSVTDTLHDALALGLVALVNREALGEGVRDQANALLDPTPTPRKKRAANVAEETRPAPVAGSRAAVGRTNTPVIQWCSRCMSQRCVHLGNAGT